MTSRDGAPSVSESDRMPPPSEALVWDALRTVIDPELGLDIVTLGLVYEVECHPDRVRVTFTLTTPGCPMEHHITEGIRRAVTLVHGNAQVTLNLVWDPRWHAGMIQRGAW